MSSTSPRPCDTSRTASNFRQTCGFCGCIYRVEITWRTSHSYKAGQDEQTYSCPECGRDCKIKTSSVPQIFLISKRTDGRAGPYTHH